MHGEGLELPHHDRPRRQLRLTAAGLLASALLAACGQPPQPSAGPAQVIAADGVLCDLTNRLAGNDLRVRCLLAPTDDPHRIQLTPQQTKDLREAPLVLVNGYGLTPGLNKLSNSVAVAELAVPDSPQLESSPEAEHSDQHDHDHHHRHGDRDPHVWHDPRQAAAMVTVVSQRLQAEAPAAAARIRQRATAMQQLLGELHQWNRHQFGSIPGPAVLATGHRALASLAQAYQLAELPLVDGSSSSDVLRPQALATVVQELKARRVPALFAEQQPPSRALSRISAVSGIPLSREALVVDGLAAKADGTAADLISTLTANTCLITNKLQGRCDQRSGQQLAQRWQAIR